jgi:hypothetical protein
MEGQRKAARRPGALGEHRHCGLARRRVTARRRAVLVVSETERPHPRLARGRTAVVRSFRLIHNEDGVALAEPNALRFDPAMGCLLS